MTKFLFPKKDHKVGPRKQQITGAGDHQMNHVTAAVLSQSDGRYKDERANIEGAKVPVIIHADNSKTTEKNYQNNDGLICTT